MHGHPDAAAFQHGLTPNGPAAALARYELTRDADFRGRRNYVRQFQTMPFLSESSDSQQKRGSLPQVQTVVGRPGVRKPERRALVPLSLREVQRVSVS